MIKINGGTKINVDVSINKIIYVKSNMSGILVHAFMEVENIQQVLWTIQLLFVMKL